MRRGFLPAVVTAYLLCRLFSFVLLSVVAGYQAPVQWTGPDPDYLSMAVLWDGSWYRFIAEQGYPVPLPHDPVTGAVQQNAWAFYPAFPMAARLLMWLTGLAFPVVASTLSLVLGVAAAAVMAVLLRDRVGPRVALAAVVVWGSFPAAPTLQIAYSESMAILLLCCFLLAVSRERWLVAAGLALLMGLTRPIAVPLGVVALVAVWLRWRRREEVPLRRGERASMLATLAACGLSGLTWPVLVWARTGESRGYTDTMATWRGSGEVTLFTPWLDMSRYLYGDQGPFWLVVLAVSLLLLVLGPWARSLGPLLRCWCLAYPAYLGAVLDPSTSIVRYLLPLFPLAVVAVGGGWAAVGGGAAAVGGGAAARRPSWLAVRTAPVVLAFLVLQVWWVWWLLRFVPPTDFPP